MSARYKDATVALPEVFVAGKVGIVTVTFNSETVLADFFESLAGQSYSNFILIAVDNASTDGTLSLLEGYCPDHRIVIANSTNRGVAEANNQGIRTAIELGCEYVMLLNNDVVLDKHILARLVDGLSKHQCCMTTPMMYFHDRPDRIWAAGGGFYSRSGFRVYHRHAWEEDSPQSERAMRIDYTPTCCVLIRREVFARIGLMDQRYFVYSDDVDFMFRASQGGVAMFFIPSAKLWHKVNGLTGGSESDFSYFYNARGRALFLYKHLNRGSAFFWTTLHAGFDLLRAVFRTDFRHPYRVKRRGMKEGRQTALKPLDAEDGA